MAAGGDASGFRVLHGTCCRITDVAEIVASPQTRPQRKRLLETGEGQAILEAAYSFNKEGQLLLKKFAAAKQRKAILGERHGNRGDNRPSVSRGRPSSPNSSAPAKEGRERLQQSPHLSAERKNSKKVTKKSEADSHHRTPNDDSRPHLQAQGGSKSPACKNRRRHDGAVDSQHLQQAAAKVHLSGGSPERIQDAVNVDGSGPVVPNQGEERRKRRLMKKREAKRRRMMDQKKKQEQRSSRQVSAAEINESSGEYPTAPDGTDELPDPDNANHPVPGAAHDHIRPETVKKHLASHREGPKKAKGMAGDSPSDEKDLADDEGSADEKPSPDGAKGANADISVPKQAPGPAPGNDTSKFMATSCNGTPENQAAGKTTALADLTYVISRDAELVCSIRDADNPGLTVSDEVFFQERNYGYFSKSFVGWKPIMEESGDESPSEHICTVVLYDLSCHVSPVWSSAMFLDFYILTRIELLGQKAEGIVLIPAMLTYRIFRRLGREKGRCWSQRVVTKMQASGLRDGSDKKVLLSVVHACKETHFILVVVNLDEALLHIYDSLGVTGSLARGYCNYQAALERSTEEGVECPFKPDEISCIAETFREVTGKDWRDVQFIRCAQQPDEASCGPFVLKNAEHVLDKLAGVIDEDTFNKRKQELPVDCALLRADQLRFVCSNSSLYKSGCPVCLAEFEDLADEAVTCLACSRMFHANLSCSGWTGTREDGWLCYVCGVVLGTREREYVRQESLEKLGYRTSDDLHLESCLCPETVTSAECRMYSEAMGRVRERHLPVLSP